MVKMPNVLEMYAAISTQLESVCSSSWAAVHLQNAVQWLQEVPTCRQGGS